MNRDAVQVEITATCTWRINNPSKLLPQYLARNETINEREGIMKGKMFISLLLMMTLLFTIIPTVALADVGYSYIDEDGNIKTTGELTVTPITTDTATLSSGWYVVSSDVIRNGSITVNGSANLILADGYTLSVTGNSNKAGIGVSNGNSLTIYGQGADTGTLNAQGGQYGAGIGGGYNANAGTTTITGGTVTATGGQNSAGIGGSYHNIYGAEYGNGGTIIINGGNITANGNGYGAGIGGGLNGKSGIISISGGVVNATSGDLSVASGAAGIGGGAGRGAEEVTISGGTIVATALDYGAGIGGGDRGGGGTIQISGGEVTASSRYGGAGIGGGWDGSGGTTTINGGTVIATSQYGGAGIGGGYSASSGTINIHGGHITAYGGQWGAGIGGGGGSSCNTITITDGIIYATGDYNAVPAAGGAGIGSGGANAGGSQSGGVIEILGGKVTAKGGSLYSEYGFDIGRGRNGINGTVLIGDGAIVTLAGQGVNSSVSTFGTCVIKGSGAGGQTGVYEDGTRLATTVIDLESSTLSNGVGYTVSGDTVVLSGNGNTYSLVGATTSRRITVASGSSANVIMFAVNIAPASGCAFNMTGATVNMRLMFVNRLLSGTSFAGIQAPFGSVLTINGSGYLTTSGGTNGAGIGGSNGMSGGNISIIGGNIEAIGKGGGAGVGGGNGSDGGSVLVDGEDTALTATGGANGFDIGSGNRQILGGSLTIQNHGTVVMTRNGTDGLKNYITGMVSGTGSQLDAGEYLDSKKLLACTGITASPASGAKAFDIVTLTAHVTNLSSINAQGKIIFYDNGQEIGRSPLYREVDGGTKATAVLRLWTALGGTHSLTAEYIQDKGWDSYYMAEAGSLNYQVAPIEQATLSLVGLPDIVTYGDPSFSLAVSGGNGRGSLSYAVTEGDAVSVNASTGVVTLVKAGSATVTVTKTGDSNYNPKSASVNITVNKAIPPVLNYPSAGTITYGQPLSESSLTGGCGDGTFAWENPDMIPTVINKGFKVVFTPNDIENYMAVEQTVELAVKKATQTPLTISGVQDNLTFGDEPFYLIVDGGSGTGTLSYAVTSGEAVAVDDSGKVTITHAGEAEIKVTNLGDDNYLPVSYTFLLMVNKAAQTTALTFELPEHIVYGDEPFQIFGSGGSGSGELSYSVTFGDAVAVSETGMITALKPGRSIITVTKAGNDDYLSQKKELPLIVNKGEQNTLTISGIPATVVAGQDPFKLIVSGGSGTGVLSYKVGSGNFVNVDASGVVTILKKGKALLSVTKAEDDYYLTAMATAEIYVGEAEPAMEEAPLASPAPSVSSTAISVPNPTATDRTRPSVTDIPSSQVRAPVSVMLKPLSIQKDEKTDKIVLTFLMDDLPEGSTAIKLPSGEIIQIDRTHNSFEFFIDQEDINKDGKMMITALDQEHTPVGNYLIDLSDNVWQNDTFNGRAGFDSILIWIVAGVLVIGGGMTAMFVFLSKKK